MIVTITLSLSLSSSFSIYLCLSILLIISMYWNVHNQFYCKCITILAHKLQCCIVILLRNRKKKNWSYETFKIIEIWLVYTSNHKMWGPMNSPRARWKMSLKIKNKIKNSLLLVSFFFHFHSCLPSILADRKLFGELKSERRSFNNGVCFFFFLN